MHVERNVVFTNLRLSVCPVPVVGLNECTITYRHIFEYVMASFQFYVLPPLQNIKGNSLLDDVKYTG